MGPVDDPQSTVRFADDVVASQVTMVQRGAHREQWHHAAGCRRWFNVERDTVSYAIWAVYRLDEEPAPSPAPSKEEPAR